MHIVFVTVELETTNSSSGGLATFTANMVRLFSKHGHKVTIILTTTKEDGTELNESGIELRKVHIPMKQWRMNDRISKFMSPFSNDKARVLRICFNMLYKAKQVQQELELIDKGSHIDLVHYCNLAATSFYAKRTIPYVIRMSSFGMCLREYQKPDIRNVKPKLSMIDSERMNIITYRKARYIISPSILTYNVMQKYLGIMPTIIESPFFLQSQSWDDSLYMEKLHNLKYIFHFGRMSQYKGTHIVAKTVNCILKKYPDLYLVLAGDNEIIYTQEHPEGVLAYEEIVRMAGKFSDRVIYLGKLVREQLYPVLQNAELVYLPYRFDNLPNAAVESIALEKITIGTKNAGFDQIIEDRVSGYLCERDNSESYIKAIDEALAMDEQARSRMKCEMKNQLKKFEPETVYYKYLNYYQKVIREW